MTPLGHHGGERRAAQVDSNGPRRAPAAHGEPRDLFAGFSEHAAGIVTAAALQLGVLLALPLALAATNSAVRWYLPLLAGAVLGAVRAPLLARLRRRVRPELFRRAAARSLDAHGQLPEAQAEQAFWGTLIAERVVVGSVPTALAACVALATTLVLASADLGGGAVLGLALTASGALGARELLRRRRQSLFDAEKHSRGRAAVWFAAVARGGDEIRDARARGHLFASLLTACDAWSAAEDRRERVLRRQWLWLRVACAGPAIWFVADAVGLRPWELGRAITARGLAEWKGLALLLAAAPATLALGRALDEIGSARRHLHHAQPGASDPTRTRFDPFPTGELAVVASRVSVQYGASVGLSGASFSVPLRGLLAIVGPNGSGKSTLARLLAGALAPSSGALTICGVPAAALDPGSVAMVPQSPLLLDALSIEDNARLVAPDVTPAALSATLAALGSCQPLGASLGGLSRGERQRVAIARAILKNARLLVLDEPDAALDAAGRQALLSVLRAESQARAVVLVTHRTDLASASDQILVLAAGHTVEALGTPSEVTERSPTYARLRAATTADGA